MSNPLKKSHQQRLEQINKKPKKRTFQKFKKRVFGLEFYTKYKYLRRFHRWPDFKNPTRFSEKLFHRLFHTHEQHFARLADKVRVRDYVRDRVGEDILVPAYGIYDRITPEIILATGASKLVLKNNHNSSSVLIVDTQKDDLNVVCQIVNHKAKQVYGEEGGEYWYRCIEPKILVEKYLGQANGELPMDYRFHTFNQGNGEFKIVVRVHYYEGSQRSFSYYDENLKLLPFSLKKETNHFIDREPFAGFEQMKAITRKLAADFDYVSVDLLESDGQIYFSELTFSPRAGFYQLSPDEYDEWMGSLWKLPTNDSRA